MIERSFYIAQLTFLSLPCEAAPLTNLSCQALRNLLTNQCQMEWNGRWKGVFVTAGSHDRALPQLIQLVEVSLRKMVIDGSGFQGRLTRWFCATNHPTLSVISVLSCRVNFSGCVQILHHEYLPCTKTFILWWQLSFEKYELRLVNGTPCAKAEH